MSAKPRRVLVVDDEPDTCANLSDILTDLGFEVDVAYDGPSALHLVRQKPYDVALLDLKMPGMDGVELYRRIKEVRADTVAIIVTAYATDATARQALDHGAWKILPKPVDLSRLLDIMDDAMGRPLLMIIDDDPDLCESLWDVFRQHNFRVALARSVEEASRRLGEANFHVALIDMKLPGGDGSQVYRFVRQTNPEARTVVITGHRNETEELIGKLLAAGADEVCYKPFDVAQLVETVTRLASGDPSSTLKNP